MQLLVNFEFYIKKIFICFFFQFFLIKFDKHVNMTDLFNKWVMLGLRNLDPFNKYVGLVLTRIVEFL